MDEWSKAQSVHFKADDGGARTLGVPFMHFYTALRLNLILLKLCQHMNSLSHEIISCGGQTPPYCASVILRNASPISAELSGRTRRAISLPFLMKISVGHSVTRKERPSGRPLPSSTLMWRTGWYGAKAGNRRLGSTAIAAPGGAKLYDGRTLKRINLITGWLDSGVRVVHAPHYNPLTRGRRSGVAAYR